MQGENSTQKLAPAFARPIRPRWRIIDQPLSIQFLAAGGVVALFSVFSLVLLLVQVNRQANASRWLGQTHRTIGKLNTLQREVLRQHQNFIEYAKAPDAKRLAEINEGRELWTNNYKAVWPALSTNPKQLEYLSHLDESYWSWLKISDRVLMAMKRGVRPIALHPEDVRQASANVREAMQIIDRMIEAENHLLSFRDREQKSAVQTTFTVIAGINIALLLIFGVVLTNLYDSIAKPIAFLSRGMDKYRKGDFGVRLRVSSASEIGFLEASFNEMAEKIEAMVKDLRKLDEMKTDFLSTVSHELRTPLTSIGGYAKLLITGDVGPVTDLQKEFLGIIDTNVHRLTHLINDILDVEKMESGRVQLLKEPQDLVSILRECKDTFDVVAVQKGLEMKFRVPHSLKTVSGDRMRLIQVFMNLISNAIKYTKQGYVHVEAEDHGYAVVIRVRDSGIGLTPEEKEKLFQKFYRTRSGLASSEGGTGLGLVIVRGLVEAHGGTITVDSTPGVGTTFTVSLPTGEKKPEESLARPQEKRELSIWIVDRNYMDLEKMKELIVREKPALPATEIEVKGFPNVAAIGDFKELSAPALVILDPSGETNPKDAITALRAILHKTVSVLIVSSAIDPADAFAEGASGLLTKPLIETEFLIAVKDLLNSNGWRVLVADRNTDFRILIKRALEQKGYKVDDVDHGRLVLDRLEQEDYDLALIDLDFPDLKGPELMRAIKRSDGAASLPLFVMVEGDKGTPSEADLKTWGATRFVGKYLGIQGVVSSVSKYLEERKTREQPH